MLFGKELKPLSISESQTESAAHVQAKPSAIQKSLERALALPAHGWYVLDASRRIQIKPAAYYVAGQELVAWRANGTLYVTNNSCPHMGAPLSSGHVHNDKIVCPWHGLRLEKNGRGGQSFYPSYDDGILSWVCLDKTDKTRPRPIVPARPDSPIDGVIRMVAHCDPSDVIANRLDPWHGSWFHYHTFARLKVLDEKEDVLTVRVAFRVFKQFCVEVDCTFHCPDSRTIVMTIVDGEGIGSVVETHATPLVPGYTAIIEATLADSERLGFRAVRQLTPLLRLFVERRARRLWVEDAAYAERKYALRQESQLPLIRDRDWYTVPGTPRA